LNCAWELIQSAEYRVNKDFYNDGNPVIIKLCDFKKKNGQLEYSKLMKKFSVIKSKILEVERFRRR